MPSGVYENNEVRINFGKFAANPATLDGSAPGPFSKPAQSGDYFKDFQELVKFCKQPEQPSYVQQVSSSDGWLCELYILPPLSENTAADVDRIQTALKNQRESLKHSSQSEIQKLKLGHWSVWQWRFQLGKTRLDHFLVFSTKHNYLFVSSPYGDRGEIPGLIKKMQVIQPGS